MKQLLNILALVLLANIAVAQAPQGIPYQAAARNSSGAVLASTNISVRFTIRDSIATGAIKYRETHSVTTTAQGMFSVNVGQGTVVSGTFAGINWATNAKFLQVEMDPAGGSSYIELGTQQMMSVPYALNAGNAFTHYVGEIWGGGVVYHVYRGADGNEHGLIVATTDQSTGIEWSNVNDVEVGSTAQSSWNGLGNSNAIVAQAGHTYSAAKLCLDFVSGEYDDWYLPSIRELQLLYNSQLDINRSFSLIGGATELYQFGLYWSSSENNAFNAWFILFDNGYASFNNKLNTYYVRAVRAF
jgi:hypothetical protein